MHQFLDIIFLGRELHQTLLAPVCSKYGITYTEIIILLFLANNPRCNTATDIVKRSHFTKSSVSMSVRTLQDRGLLSGEFADGNHRSIHLKLCGAAQGIIEESTAAQKGLFPMMFDGFSEEEITNFRRDIERVSDNIKEHCFQAHSAPESKRPQPIQEKESFS